MFGWKQKTYQHILENLTEGVYVVDLDQKIQFWNKSAEAMTGFSAGEMVGRSLDEVSIGYEDESGHELKPFEYPVALCLQEKKNINRNFFVNSRDNRKIPIDENASPLFSKDKMTGAVVTFKDISGCINTVAERLKAEKRERLVPICGWCKKIRNEQDYWEKLENFLTKDGVGVFTHGMCPDCAEKIFEKKLYLESYQNICKAISASISVDEVLNLIVTNVVKVMNVKASLLRLLNKETRQLEIAAYHGLSEKYANKGPVAYDASIDDALAGRSASVYDITEHEDSKYYNEAVEEGIRSILSIPLRVEKEVIGVLRMYTAEPVDYNDDDLKFITALAEQAAIGIMNARQFETALANEKEYLRVFEEITKTVSSTLDLNEILYVIVRKIPEAMGLKGATLRLLNKEKKQLELASYFGLSDKYANKGPVAYDASIDDAMAGKAVSEYDITEHEDSEYYKEAVEEGIRTILTVPMRFQNELIGVLRLYSDKPIKYKDTDLKFMSGISEQTAIAIVNARHFETEISREKEYLRVFEEITKTVSSTLNLNEMLDMIVRKIPEVMSLKGATLRLLNREKKQLELASYFGLSDKYVNKGTVAYDASINDAMAGKPVSEYDITEHKDSEYYKEAVEEGIRTILTVPMRFQNELIGVLRLYSDKPVKYKDTDLKFMSGISEQTAIAIVNVKHFETAISREKEYLRVFEEISKAVSSTLNVREVLDLIVRKLPEVMNLKAATIRLFDHTGEKLKLAAAYGLSDKYLSRGPIDTEENVKKALSEKPVAIHDVTTDSRIKYQKEAAEEGIKSILTLPVIARGKVLGILRLLTAETREFAQQEIDFSASLAEQSGIAIENAILYEKTKKDYNDIMNNLDDSVIGKE
ncbi:MAG: GAF domain-containing protein [Nitrospirota bacterium]